MRLDNKQKNALFKAIEGIENEIYLFGSRVDDTKKGGDISFYYGRICNGIIKS